MMTLTPHDWQDRQPDSVQADAAGIVLTYPGGTWAVQLDFADTRTVCLTGFGGQTLWWLHDQQKGDWLIPVGIPGEAQLRQVLQAQFPGFDGHSMYRVLADDQPPNEPVTLWQS